MRHLNTIIVIECLSEHAGAQWAPNLMAGRGG
jgi:hypothetical protein